MRRDLSPSQIAVQAAHAVYEAATLRNPDLDHPHFVLLGIRDLNQLQNALARIQSSGISVCPFYESDLNDELTAFATEPIFENQRHLFKKYNCINDRNFVKAEHGIISPPCRFNSLAIEKEIV